LPAALAQRADQDKLLANTVLSEDIGLMNAELKLHRNSPLSAVQRIEAVVERPQPCRLVLDYTAHGDMAAVAVPEPGPTARTDELWRHTCFEAFIRPANGNLYVELNLSPSTAWAAYLFDAYRAGMREAEIGPPSIKVDAGGHAIQLQASLDLEPLTTLLGDGPWLVGLSAVIEGRDGNTGYWALAHPPGKADFHHEHCFALELPPPKRT
jgi:hypothetical protein